MQEYIKTPLLHCDFGVLDPNKIDSRASYIFIMRNTSAKITDYDTREECQAELPKRFIYGTIKGHAMQTASDLLELIYKEAVEYQFQEPKIMEESQAVRSNALEESRSGHSINIMDFSRPSDFRKKAVKAKKVG